MEMLVFVLAFAVWVTIWLAGVAAAMTGYRGPPR